MSKKTIKATLPQNQKYRKALELGQKIAGFASQVGMCDFREKFSLLESLFEYWQCDIPIAIVPKEDTSMKEQHETMGDSTVKRQDDEK